MLKSLKKLIAQPQVYIANKLVDLYPHDMEWLKPIAKKYIGLLEPFPYSLWPSNYIHNLKVLQNAQKEVYLELQKKRNNLHYSKCTPKELEQWALENPDYAEYVYHWNN